VSIDLKDYNDSPYIVSDEFDVGHVFPPVEVVKIAGAEVPVPGSTKKNRKIIIYFKGAEKGWCANKTELRKLGRQFGATKGIETAWIGARIQLCVVGDVRRPDGTRGNALRVKEAWAPRQSPAGGAQ
jgi:hypothetical protein